MIRQSFYLMTGILPCSIVVMLLFWGCQHQDSVSPLSPLSCRWDGVNAPVSLDTIGCSNDFSILSGTPITPTLSGVQSVKVVYDIETKMLYFVSTEAYALHFSFCSTVLGYSGTHQQFNTDQYGSGPQRLYYLASINRYLSSGIYALQFFADDQISAEGIRLLYTELSNRCFFGDTLAFLPNSTTLAAKVPLLDGVPVISEEQIYRGQQYQALNPAIGYGYLKKVPYEELGTTLLSRHDIVVTNGVPIALPVIAGIITGEFQTPLSHVNVLSHNRGTPNMALRGVWEDTAIVNLHGKLVCLSVLPDSFALNVVALEEAKAFWDSREMRPLQVLACQDTTTGLFALDELSYASSAMVGGKAANLAEISGLLLGAETMPIPEGAFAIPFYYYRHHCRENGIDDIIVAMLNDTLFLQDVVYRDSVLAGVRDTIKAAPLDEHLAEDVVAQCRSVSSFSRIRFRSSTNAEDVSGFNGAGLYESHSAELSEGVSSVTTAIKEVYASLWTLRGFEEREYFNIDQMSCAMGILVHRAFQNEEANGVAITANIYQAYLPAYTINAQVKDISVVLPPAGFQSDQLLVHLLRFDWKERPVIEYIAHSNVNFGDPVLLPEELVVLAKWLERIKDHFYAFAAATDYYRFAMDVEFKLDGPQRTLYIKQARPYSLEQEAP